jgi:hypothetical protein
MHEPRVQRRPVAQRRPDRRQSTRQTESVRRLERRALVSFRQQELLHVRPIVSVGAVITVVCHRRVERRRRLLHRRRHHRRQRRRVQNSRLADACNASLYAECVARSLPKSGAIKSKSSPSTTGNLASMSVSSLPSKPRSLATDASDTSASLTPPDKSTEPLGINALPEDGMDEDA